jgi:hypothetical protein
MSASAIADGAKFAVGAQPCGASPPIKVATSGTSATPSIANAPAAAAGSLSATRGWATGDTAQPLISVTTQRAAPWCTVSRTS